jgi:hypothetical protein
VNDQVEILLGVVLGDLLESEFLGFRHDDGVCKELTGSVGGYRKDRRGECVEWSWR